MCWGVCVCVCIYVCVYESFSVAVTKICTKRDFGDFRSSIVDPYIGSTNLSFRILKIWVCKHQNFLVPHSSVLYLWILDPLNLGFRQY